MEPILWGVLILIHGALILNGLANVWWLWKKTKPARTTHLPPVSVLVPARNEAHNLPRLLRSFRAQNHSDAELIVYDDLSDDNTWDIVEQFSGKRIKGIKGLPLPLGWVGKVHGCYQLSLQASGRVFLFVDADTEFLSPNALSDMCARFESRPTSTVLTGMTLLKGKGQLIVSMVGNFILTSIPWWLEERVPVPALSGVNGQCWMISSEDYRRLEPHQHVRGEVLEDIMIGRYLHRSGLIPVLDDVRNELAVHMYSGFGDAWKGFRKNMSFMLGSSLLTSGLMLMLSAFVFIYAPFVSLWFLLAMYMSKIVTDRAIQQSWYVTALTPISYAFAIVIGLDSIWTRGRGRIQWKGRNIKESK